MLEIEKVKALFCFLENPNSKFRTQNSKQFLKYKLAKKKIAEEYTGYALILLQIKTDSLYIYTYVMCF